MKQSLQNKLDMLDEITTRLYTDANAGKIHIDPSALIPPFTDPETARKAKAFDKLKDGLLKNKTIPGGYRQWFELLIREAMG